MTFSLELDVPKYKLRVNRLKLHEAMARKAREILQRPGRLPSRTGAFAASTQTKSDEKEGSAGPTGDRSEIIARVFLSQGRDLFRLTDGEQAEVFAAGQAELDRQSRSKEADI